MIGLDREEAPATDIVGCFNEAVRTLQVLKVLKVMPDLEKCESCSVAARCNEQKRAWFVFGPAGGCWNQASDKVDGTAFGAMHERVPQTARMRGSSSVGAMPAAKLEKASVRWPTKAGVWASGRSPGRIRRPAIGCPRGPSTSRLRMSWLSVGRSTRVGT